MKRLIPILLLLLINLPNFAISSELNSTNKFGSITGFIKDIKSNKAIEYATISVYDREKSKLIDGTISNEDGYFEIEKLKTGNYYIEVSFIGYDKKIIQNIAIRNYLKQNNLDIIKLSHSNKALKEVVVNSDKDDIKHQIDKKIIPVSNQLSAEGGTAVDVLENAPSVSVDVSGNVSLRGSNSFTVLIDGRPTIRSAQEVLSQIPTSQIENIEIITNPSAKYNPEGTAGIINIISKKHKLKGASGLINFSPGSHDNFASSGMFNLKQKKSNFYIGADYKEQALSGKREIYRTLSNTEPEEHLDALGDMERNLKSYSVSSGFDFEIDSLNLFGITAELGKSYFDVQNNLTYDEYKLGGNHLFENSVEKAESETNYFVTTFNYLRKFKKKGHELSTFVDYTEREYDKTIVSDNQIIGAPINSFLSFLEDPGKSLTFTSDYTLPLSGKNKFEAGYKFETLKLDTDRSLEENIGNTAILHPEFNQSSDNNRTIHSLYATYSGKLNKISYQLGFRAEHINRDIKYDGDHFEIKRWDYFPTLHTQMSLGKLSKLSANYSRRIKRPRNSELEAFVIWNDRYNWSMGNPNLKPEYINSFELNYNTKLGKHSLSLESYYRMTEDKTERIKTLSEEDPNIILSGIENVGKDHTLGLEAFANLSLLKWWRNIIMADISHYKVDGEYLNSYDSNNTNKHIFSTSSMNWSLRSYSYFNLSKITQIQFIMSYKSKSKWAQGEIDDSFQTIATLKHSFFKRKLSASFIVRDVFNTADSGKTYCNEDYRLINNFDRDAPTFTLSLSYKINNYKMNRRRKGTNFDKM